MMKFLMIGFGIFLLSWYTIHSICDGYLAQLGVEAYDKKRKGQSIIEWMFFSRFKNQLPRFLRLTNHFILIGALVLAIAFVILWFFRANIPLYSILKYTAISYSGINIIWDVSMRALSPAILLRPCY